MIGAAVCSWLAVLSWRRRTSSSAILFGALMTALAVYAFGYGLELNAETVSQKLNWIRLEYLGIASIPPLWLSLMLFYTNQLGWLRLRRRLLLWIIPAITILAVFTNDFHHLFYVSVRLHVGDPFPTLITAKGPFFWLQQSYSFAAFFGGSALLIQEYIHARSVYRRQILLMILASLVTMIVITIYLTGAIPVPGLDIVPYALLISGLIITWGVFNFRLIDLNPAARDVLYKNSLDAVLVFDSQFRLVDYNPAATRTLKLSDQVIGENLRTALQPDLAQVIAHLNQKGSMVEVALNTPDERFYDIQLIPVSRQEQSNMGCLIVLHEATERKKAEERIRQSEARYRLLAENSDDVIWTMDLKGRFNYVSPSIYALRGYTPEETLQQAIQEITCPSSLEVVNASTRHLLQQSARGNTLPSQYFEIELRCKDGSSVWTETAARVIVNDQGRPVGFMGISRDISERKRMENQIKASLDELMQFNHAMVKREIRMIELKQEVNDLLTQAGRPRKYVIPPEE